MRIVIDARWIFPEISGVGAYTRELIAALARQGSRHEYALLFDRPALRDRTVEETGIAGRPNVRTFLVPWGVFSPVGQVRLPPVLRRMGADVFHSTNYMIPFLAFPRRRRRMRCVVTIHDVIPMIFPSHAPRSKKARLFPLYRRLMVEVGRRADAVLTDSEAARADILKHLRIPPADAATVRAIPCGISDRFRPADVPRRGSATVDASRPRTLLYVGRPDPYKNLGTLIRALALARAACPFEVTLAIAGSADARYPEAGRLARELNVSRSVVWHGYVSDDELVRLYREADALVHASRYEGFGLQVAEAMACGLPVVCSNAGALPEVAGDAAILLDPDDVNGFAAAIRRVLTDAGVAAELSAKGLRQAARFTWERTAAETLAAYEAAAEAGSSPPS